MQARVEVDIRQVLALFGCKGFCRRTHAGSPIELLAVPPAIGEARMNVRYRVELGQTENRNPSPSAPPGVPRVAPV
jgi:hypothetical protein